MRITELVNSPKEWKAGNMHVIAEFFFRHPNDPRIGTFLNLFPTEDSEAFNQPLLIFIRRWYYREKSSGGYLYFLGPGADLEAVLSEVTLFLVSDHLKYWEPEKFEFFRWITVNLRRNSRIGHRLCMTWRQSVGSEQSGSVLYAEDCGDEMEKHCGASLISDEMAIPYLAAEYGLSEAEVFLLITDNDFGGVEKSPGKMLEYVNLCLGEGVVKNRKELKKRIMECRAKARASIGMIRP